MGGSWNASTGNSFKFGSNQEGADYVNEHTITPQAVANYLQSQHPDWESINVSLSSGYSKRGEGFNYSAVYGTSTSEFYDDEQSGSNKDFVIGFFSIGTVQKMMESSNSSTPGFMDMTNQAITSIVVQNN